MLNDLEKHWLSILDNNICIPTYEILEGNEDEKVSYRKTTFLSDKILNNTSHATQILRKSQIVTEDFVEDLTNFVLETVPNSGDFIRCGSSSSNNDLPSSSSSSNSYSNDLKSKEANAISFVLGELSLLLKKYDNGVTIFRRLQEEKLNASDHFRANLIDIQSTLQQEVITKLSELKTEFECWERSFLINNNYCAPITNDFANNNVIGDINRKINIGHCILRNWESILY